MNILIVEPFYFGSHKQWLDGYQAHSQHVVEKLTLPKGSWRWRMRQGSTILAEQFVASDLQPDCIIASDLLDLPAFLSLTRKKTAHIPVVTYFHENQLAYPWSPKERNKDGNKIHYGFTNYCSALSSDQVWFNSTYNRDSFLLELERLLKQNPDQIDLRGVQQIQEKSFIMPLGFETEQYLRYQEVQDEERVPTIGWNHRWDREKNPELFFQILEDLKKQGDDFRLIVLGEELDTELEEFSRARTLFEQEILHFGYASSREEYLRLLSQCDILPVTSHQDFFGISIVEAILSGAIPLLPARLAYPELIPESHHQNFLYRSESELRERLSALLSEVTRPDISSLGDHLSQFDWDRVASKYDEALLCTQSKDTYSSFDSVA